MGTESLSWRYPKILRGLGPENPQDPAAADSQRVGRGQGQEPFEIVEWPATALESAIYLGEAEGLKRCERSMRAEVKIVLQYSPTHERPEPGSIMGVDQHDVLPLGKAR